MFEINKLPWELRDGIYEAALVRDVVIVAAIELQNAKTSLALPGKIPEVPQLRERESTGQESTKNPSQTLTTVNALTRVLPT
ncbi:hypothetical protein HO173_001402 [Letharia columbiana]|uniref:Uncharacterized protein n=1 Tax=Letharia columbiana TaxID=112416 RepID=A0A8H6L9H6_9LECA|nr:uncharacterized protein HO173_001402 [Letharia columbiana]KAF6240729.1 hypothetical protein HO173_001402 [Letharia columbiana]